MKYRTFINNAVINAFICKTIIKLEIQLLVGVFIFN